MLIELADATNESIVFNVHVRRGYAFMIEAHHDAGAHVDNRRGRCVCLALRPRTPTLLCRGPFLGGLLSEPADRLPSLFGSSRFFRARPFLLPPLVSVIVPAGAALLSTCYLRETLPTSKKDYELLSKDEYAEATRSPIQDSPLWTTPVKTSLLAVRHFFDRLPRS